MNITGQIFHGRIIFWRYAVVAEDVESGMFPCEEHGDHSFCDLSPGKKHPETMTVHFAFGSMVEVHG
jgi:hypothetical protein